MPHRTNDAATGHSAACLCGQRFVTALSAALSLATASLSAFAVELWSAKGGERRVTLDGAFKTTSLLSYAPDEPVLFPERLSEVGLFRSRFGIAAKHGERANTELAYEHRARVISDGAGVSAGADILPSEARAPYRIGQLDWQVVREDTRFTYRHELDRALLSLHPEWGEITIGRQAIGLGRGVLFGAVDIFSPFSPLEVDREWRRGVDAVRAEYKVSDTSSVELLAVFGEGWDDSALLGRARGYIGNVDGELIVGKRAEDTLFGGTVSATVGGAEVHLEVALFDTPEAQPEGGLFGNDHLVGKGVVGASYTFDVGNGLTLLGEYHYSGFGVRDVEEVISRLADPVFQGRYLRGDTQILGRHAAALHLTYPINDAWTGALLVLQSPADGSGLAAPSISWDIAENVSFIASGFIPWGSEPSDGRLGSEYGATPTSLFLQLNIYY